MWFILVLVSAVFSHSNYGFPGMMSAFQLWPRHFGYPIGKETLNPIWSVVGFFVSSLLPRCSWRAGWVCTFHFLLNPVATNPAQAHDASLWVTIQLSHRPCWYLPGESRAPVHTVPLTPSVGVNLAPCEALQPPGKGKVKLSWWGSITWGQKLNSLLTLGVGSRWVRYFCI